ncbi:MAG: PqiA/YebS family transporter subunit [Mariprofundales bacterium]|nr:PqiA/YebS family transporter subunit [Mariprofundales bacterium]
MGAYALIACHECDLLHHATPIAAGERAHCSRCGARLYRDVEGALQRCSALYLAALICFVLANYYPFLSLKIDDRMETIHLVNSGWALMEQGMPMLGLLVLLTSLVSPLIMVVGHLYLLLARTMCHSSHWHPPACGLVYRILRRIAPWSMVSVFMLGTLISVVKLLDLAEVIPGVGAAALMVMMLFTVAAESSFDSQLIWPHKPPHQEAGDQQVAPRSSARHNALISCHYCKLLVAERQLDGGDGRCPQCGGGLHGRKPESITRTWALLIAAMLLLIPANLYPVMTVIQLGQGDPSTILGGVVHLAEAGMWGLASIIFFASVVVPGAKLISFVWMLSTIQRSSPYRPVERTRLYRIAETIGAWSMVDIFVVALLAALVQMGELATIEPGLGALFFACVVVVTMCAAESFDSRLIWDRLPNS